MDFDGESESVDESHSEPPDPDVVEIDPSSRYIRYKEVLGRGAFKTVYKAFDQVDGIEVAWNQVRIDEVLRSCQDLDRLYSEVHLLKYLKHANIIKFYNSWINYRTKTVNIITELFTSGSLRQYRVKHKKVDAKAVKGWARQILTGLDYLHSHNPPIIHRDLKCDNIFINGNNGKVKIGDLGLATVMEQASVRSIHGTPEFMAPELYDEDYNEMADIYSFGMCMLEMVTSEYPYSECTNCAQIYKKVAAGIMPNALSKVKNLEMKQFIERCLGPVAQRLPAKELLKDSFLLTEDLAEHSPMHISGSVTPISGSFTNRQSVVSEERILSRQICSMDVDSADEIEPTIITFVQISGTSHLILELQRSKRGVKIWLKGERFGENSVKLTTRLSDPGVAGEIKTIDFLFYLDSDTALSVAREMVVSEVITDQNLMLLAESVDLLITNLIPNWKPSTPIKQLVTSNAIQIMENCHENEEGSVEAAYVSRSPLPVPESCKTISEASDLEMLDEVMSLSDFWSRNTTLAEDRGFEMSLISGTSTEGNYHSYSDDTCDFVDAGSMGSNQRGINRQNLYGVEIGVKDAGSNVSNGSSVVFVDQDEDDDDNCKEENDVEELQLQFEMIELQYQQAIEEISKKKNEAIKSLKRRLSQKKMVSVY